MGARVPSFSPQVRPPAPHALWVTRGAAAFSLLLLVLAVVVAGRERDLGGAIFAALFLSPVGLLDLVALLRLRGETVRTGAKTAIGAAAIGLWATVLAVLGAWEDGNWALRAAVSTFALTQLVLGTSGVLLLRAFPAPPQAPPMTADPRWVKRVQALALVSLAATLGPIAVFSVALAFSEGPATLLIILLSSPIWGPFALIWWRLRGRKQKEGLALAIGLGLLMLLLALVIGFVGAHSGETRWVGAYLVAFALAQVALVTVSARTYYTMPRQAGDGKLLAKWVAAGGVAAFLVLILAAIALPGTFRSREAANESSAVGSLRTIVNAAELYSAEYGSGYPPNLAVLGPPAPGEKAGCRTADLVDAMLVSGEKSGYRIEYRAGPATESAAAACPVGAKSFGAVARPLRFGRTGRRSFFTDDTGVFRVTSEDREAQPSDPPVQ